LDEEKIKEFCIEDLPETYSQLVSEIGIDNTLKIAKLFSGQYVYFLKVETIERPLRNRQIRDEFNGYNYEELAKKYNLTEIMIRNICLDIITKKRRQPFEGQLSLLG
jgi:Mor family transcriptional regulator